MPDLRSPSPVRRAAGASLLALLLLALAGTASCGVPEVVGGKIADDQSAIRALEGTCLEFGLLVEDRAAPIRSRVRYLAGSALRIDVLAPERLAGDVYFQRGGTIVLYSRATNSAIRIRGVPEWTPDSWRSHRIETTRFDLGAYGYRELGPEVVAGRESVPWIATPRVNGVARFPTESWMDARYSYPLRVRMGGPDSPVYELRYEEIAFNGPLDEAAMDFELPGDATAITWDLSAPPLEAADGRPAPDVPVFSPARPLGLPDGTGLLPVGAILPASTFVPALCHVYAGGPFHVLAFSHRDVGFLRPDRRGIDVDVGGIPGRLFFAGTSSVLSLERDGVEITLVGNLPAPLLVEFAASLRRPE